MCRASWGRFRCMGRRVHRSMTSKHWLMTLRRSALNSFTIHLAHELKDTKIKVNSAHPGWVKTDMGTDAAPMEIVDGAKTWWRWRRCRRGGPTGGYRASGGDVALVVESADRGLCGLRTDF